ncbi:hypothetical protein [Phocicoccus pinnipedialis]|uniref:Uncharacterized protein n=1 Tax=Phocicoccus pinnipedialis TaxID=110845 RepID=A0A6V7R776_9BACL|nr:hypothetical protein [Jeotgalicoccus pinnipedialis]MBP1938929.1 hypothetical protein [Jeotgalicoccus pinnipedialis]CAD2073231.1 hypothetical protein JEOPIN946_00615 [Jeotgalicoccus pinnipedialis]
MDIYVTEMKFENETLNVFTDADVSKCTSVSQMIVDSDDFSFIYLLDNGVDYVRLHFVSETWEMLERYRNRKIILNETLELTEFYDELNYLISNIEGNNNYGKEFEAKVVETFKA